MSAHQRLTGVRGILTPFIGIKIAHRFGFRTSMLFWYALMLIGFPIMLREAYGEWRLGRLTSFSGAEERLEAEFLQRQNGKEKIG